MQWILPQEKFAGKFRGAANALPIQPPAYSPHLKENQINLYELVVRFTSLQPKTGKKLWELSGFWTSPF